MPTMTLPVADERFWSHVIKTEMGCWVWTNKNGEPIETYGAWRGRPAHRVALASRIPDPEVARWERIRAARRKVVWPIQTAKREASKQAQRDAGQVWWAIYDRYHARGRLECFTLEDAKDYLSYGSAQGELAPVGIELPDGTISNDWRTDDDDDDG